MLDLNRKQQYLASFAEVEASFRIERMDPSGDPLYESAKAAILADILTPQQTLEVAIAETVAELKGSIVTAA